MNKLKSCAFLLCLTCGLISAVFPAAEAPFRIQVVDAQTGRGVPLVELQTVNNIRYYTDSQGVAAIDEPGLMGRDVFFHVKSHGYEYPRDGFGFRGKALPVTAGGSSKLTLKRLNIAERLYRVTGAGIYRDSLLTGMPVPIREPLLNAQVFGSDSVLNAVFRGKLYWFWGDTNRPSYPLGIFDTPGATSRLPADGGLDPAVGIDLEYFTGPDGLARGVAKMPGEGPTWLNGLTVVPDENGREQLFAVYMKVKPPLEVYQYGLARFDDTATTFRSVAEFGRDPHVAPLGHPIHLRDGSTEYVHFGSTIPFIRAPARAQALQRLEEYEAFTCLRPGSRLDKPEIDRGPDGAARYAWKRNTPAVGPKEQADLVKKQLLKPHEGLFQLCDRDTGRPLQAHFGSVYWNEHRKRFLLICVQAGGTSNLGEVWYAEGDSPVGPWVYAVKIVTHERYSFYNPKRHPMFDQEGGRVIYFEGTYTNSFSGNPEQTPRYDYNQVMYRLDLGDSRLTLPVAIYRSTGPGPVRFASRQAATANEAGAPPDLTSIAFFACERPREDLIAVHIEATSAPFALTLEPGDAAVRRPIAFYAMPAVADSPPPAAVPLHEYVHDDGRREYSIDPEAKLTGFHRQEKPLCLVWRNPFAPR